MNAAAVNDSLLLPLKTDVKKLESDLQICLEARWKEHFNDRDYSGSWTAIALRSQSGNAEDINAHNSDEPFIDTLLMNECAYFKTILDELKFEKETIRLLRLQPGSVIKEHRDRGLSYRFGCFRLHIPIVTDAAVAFMVGGKNIPMKKGECWYADFDLLHSVNNESAQERIHLVIDGKRNEWTDKLFAAAGYDFEEEKQKNDPSVETKKQMIEQLRSMKTPAADEVIRKLEMEIAAVLNAGENAN
ncbi:MAG: Aspartyl/Asparaginyl beta-hydroxylase [Bacteroidetes bacterium]|nr:Aspartyl/Asparaginyl beta-hydroxylase [Bacteroidota bacterium]